MINTFSAFFMRRRNWTIPYVLFLAIFVVIPLLLIVYYAFTNDEGMFTFANFRKFMIHPEAINTFVYSVGIALITTILCLLLGYPAAWILSQARFNTSRTMVVLFILPMWVNILIRTTIVIIGATIVYCLYYKYAHFVLGTQKGFSHPQQFPMIPMIWLINIWLINWWFMDGWPGWRLRMRSVEQVEESIKKTEEEDTWRAEMGWGLVLGVVAGIAFFALLVWLLPVLSANFTLVE